MFEEIKTKIGQHVVYTSIKEAMKNLKSTRLFALDIETSGFEKKVGGVSTCENYGICGIALCNLMGDAAYFLVEDSRKDGGVPIQEMIEYLNNFWFANGALVVIHNSHYDLSFMIRRGLKLGSVKIYDSWAMSSIMSQGVFSSNKLKDIVREKFKIDTSTEDVKEKFFVENKTRDYGDLPLELIAPYACDDTRYALLLALDSKEQDWPIHDLLVRNVQHLIKAEHRGVLVDRELVKKRLEYISDLLVSGKSELKKLLGAAEVNPDDDQVMMRYLHVNNLHSAPRSNYGKIEYVFDGEYLQACSKHPLADTYFTYILRRNFKQAFSIQDGDMFDRYFVENKNVGFYPNFQPSIHAKGGLIQMRSPDLMYKVKLENSIRELFKPREGYEFVSIQAVNLPVLLLAFYTQDKELEAACRSGIDLLGFLVGRSGLKLEACRCLLRQMIEGSGNANLERRLKIAEVSVGGKAHLGMRDKFETSFPSYRSVQVSIEQAATHEGHVRDRIGRILKILPDKMWRAFAFLLNSSNGSILATYFDLFCRLADETGAKLVLVHEKEAVWEVEKDSTEFLNSCRDLIQRPILDPMPVWNIKQASKWTGAPDAHEPVERG